MAHDRCCPGRRERADIASDPARRADGVVVLKASLASSLGREVGPEISSCTELSVAVALLVKSATGAHPHVGGSTAENCAALGMVPMGDTSRHARPLTGTRTRRMWPQPANSSRWASVAADRALARLVSTRGRERAEMGVQRRSWFNRVRVLGAGAIPAARSAFSHWAKVVMTPS